MDTIHRIDEGELILRMELYDAYGFWISQFQTQGGTMCARDSIGELVSAGRNAKSKWGVVFPYSSGALMREMNSFLVEVAGVPTMYGGWRLVES